MRENGLRTVAIGLCALCAALPACSDGNVALIDDFSGIERIPLVVCRWLSLDGLAPDLDALTTGIHVELCYGVDQAATEVEGCLVQVTAINEVHCGDGEVNCGRCFPENCDDGDFCIDGNGCSTVCHRDDVCGDGSLQELHEECDDGSECLSGPNTGSRCFLKGPNHYFGGNPDDIYCDGHPCGTRAGDGCDEVCRLEP